MRLENNYKIFENICHPDPAIQRGKDSEVKAFITGFFPSRSESYFLLLFEKIFGHFSLKFFQFTFPDRLGQNDKKKSNSLFVLPQFMKA